jgi:5'(3')-deoxyribonucleotidase
LRGPYEDATQETVHNPPPYIEARRRLMLSAPGFWRNLKPLALGFQLFKVFVELNFDIYVVTKGPSGSTQAWAKKVEWCRQHVPDAQIVIADDKSIVGGNVLVEDWPPYIESWLHRWPRGFVIVPARSWNIDIEARFYGMAIRYDGRNLEILRQRLESIRVKCQKKRSVLPVEKW